MLGSTGAGHLIVVAVQTDAASTVASVTDDAAGGSNGYVAVPGSRATNGAPSEGIELWYAEGARAGATTVTATGGTGMSIVAWEFSGIATTNALDVGAALDNGVSSMTPVGPMLTTRQAGEVVVSAIVLPGQIGSIRLGNEFTNDLVTNDNGWAHLTSTAAPAGAHQAQWSANTAGAYCAAAAAFVTGP